MNSKPNTVQALAHPWFELSDEDLASRDLGKNLGQMKVSEGGQRNTLPLV